MLGVEFTHCCYCLEFFNPDRSNLKLYQNKTFKMFMEKIEQLVAMLEKQELEVVSLANLYFWYFTFNFIILDFDQCSIVFGIILGISLFKRLVGAIY